MTGSNHLPGKVYLEDVPADKGMKSVLLRNPRRLRLELICGNLPNPPGFGEDLTGTILLVEDEEMVSSVIARVLGIMGFEVVRARDGREALREFLRDPGAVSLVMTDLVMPELGGADLVKCLRVKAPDLPILVYSGYPDQALDPAFAEDPKIRLLAKPVHTHELLNCLRQLMAGA